MAARDTDGEVIRRKRGELLGSLKRSSEKLKIAGDELKKAERLETESAEKISHECRSLLNVVIGFTELMLDEVVGEINDEQRSSLTEILNSARRLLYLINVPDEPSVQKSKGKK
jgi:signal transduction histidine kinase